MKENGANFYNEALKRLSEKVVTSKEQVDRWVETGERASELISALARLGNPVWQKEVALIRPPLTYGTVDGFGNVAELLMMQSMAKKLGVPLVLFLDDGAYNVDSSFERLTESSLSLLDLKKNQYALPTYGRKCGEIGAGGFFPEKVKDGLIELGIGVNELSVGEVYRQVLYSLAIEFFGEQAIKEVSIVPTMRMLRETLVGEVRLEDLRELVGKVAKKMGKQEVVFLHSGGEQKISSRWSVSEETLLDWYNRDGWLGGTAWVVLTAMMLSEDRLPGGGAMIMGEKDTALGGNFASAYEVIDRELPTGRLKVATSAVRRIRASGNQNGGDGIDPVILLLWMKGSPMGEAVKELILEELEEAFPIRGESGEKAVVLDNQAQMRMAVQRLIKGQTGIDGHFLMERGLRGRQIGEVINRLIELFLSGGQLTSEKLEQIIASSDSSEH